MEYDDKNDLQVNIVYWMFWYVQVHYNNNMTLTRTVNFLFDWSIFYALVFRPWQLLSSYHNARLHLVLYWKNIHNRSLTLSSFLIVLFKDMLLMLLNRGLNVLIEYENIEPKQLFLAASFVQGGLQNVRRGTKNDRRH